MPVRQVFSPAISWIGSRMKRSGSENQILQMCAQLIVAVVALHESRVSLGEQRSIRCCS